jgi:hypothetical protein
MKDIRAKWLLMKSKVIVHRHGQGAKEKPKSWRALMRRLIPVGSTRHPRQDEPLKIDGEIYKWRRVTGDFFRKRIEHYSA